LREEVAVNEQALVIEIRKYKILVVDDSVVNRELLAAQVQAEGYQAATAKDGKQAIQMIQTGTFDLILLDIIMPEIDGYEVLKWIRHSPWNHIPTIMISALEQIDSVVKCIEMGAEDYLTKPFNSILLKARLEACLEQKRLRDLEAVYLRQLTKVNQQISQFNNSLQVENTRLSSELEVTQRLQQMLLPKEQELQQIEPLEIAGFSEAAAEIGGDYYDVIQHAGHIFIGIGDVSGHGLESGVLMLMVQTAIRTLIENNETAPKHLFEVLNQTIYKNIQRLNSDKHITLSLVEYYDGMLSISGQHEEVLLVRQGEIIRIDTINLGFPLGLVESIADLIFETQIPLEISEVAVLYTDGITEAENSQGIHYGLERLCNVVQENWQKSAPDIRQVVIQDLRSHIGTEQVYDDITLVVLKRKADS
jgi:serine phosphatase RsbU (regulator of sigma subunit)